MATIRGSRNPFHYLRPVSPEEFFGRWPLVQEIARDLTLDNGDSYALIGGRRFGKSSLLAALHHYLRSPDLPQGDHIVLPLLLDCKQCNFSSETTFFATVLHEVRRRVDAGSRSRSRDPSPVKVPLDQAWLDSLLTGDPPGLTLSRFSEALDYILDELHDAGGATRLVLLLDEVDDALRYPWHQVLFGQLRSLVYTGDLADNVRLVLAGSRRFLDQVTEQGSPLWNVLKLHYLIAFDQAATFELMERAPGLSDAGQQAVWQQSGGHPFLAQYLLHHLWRSGIDQSDETTVSQLVSRFLHEEQAHLAGWAKAVRASGLHVYGQLVDRADWLDEITLIRAIDDPSVPVKRALVDLCYHGFVVHDGSWSRYRYTGDLFRQWFLSEHRDSLEKGEGNTIPVEPAVAAQAASFLFEIGRWAASELKERWTFSREKMGAKQPTEVNLAKSEAEIKQQSQELMQEVAAERGAAEVKRVVKLIERKRGLVLEWKEVKLYNEEAFNRQELDRAAYRLKQQELDQKIAQAMAEIESDLRELGVRIRREKEE